jgi:hypothetical protein
LSQQNGFRNRQEKILIRRLASELAEIARLPVQQKKIDLWKSLNGLRMKRPMVMVYSFPWAEAEAVSPELKLESADPFHRQIEQHLRRLLFKWHYLRADMVLEPVYRSPIYIEDTSIRLKTGQGLGSSGDTSQTLSFCANVHTIDAGNPRNAKSFKPVLRNEADIDRIAMPEIRVNQQRTEEEYSRSCELLEPVLKVVKCGVQVMPFAPMDSLLELWGINELFIDMVERPELIHQAMAKLVDTHLSRLDQFKALNLLSLNSRSAGTITQGMGECLTDELPGAAFNPAAVRPADMWGGATAQILSGVSPAMHDEFALTHERRWLEQFGLTAYGCCEPLHKKIAILKSITNLRKVSMSSWIQPEEAVAEIGGRYVFSYKPKPTFLAMDTLNLEPARREIEQILRLTRNYGCPVELILRTIISCRQDPKRMTDWIRMAMDLVGAGE